LEQFKDVQYKLQADQSKSSLDNKKYKQLLQGIIGRLSIFNEPANPRRYICIEIIDNISQNFPECELPDLSLGYREGMNIMAEASKPPIKTELQNTDVNLIRALAVDLKSFGYGRLMYTKRLYNCRGCSGNHVGIILNSKNTETYFEHEHSNWTSI
jgi:hypothetical protein